MSNDIKVDKKSGTWWISDFRIALESLLDNDIDFINTF